MGVLGNNDDTPMGCLREQVGQGGQRLDKYLKKTYHKRQQQLFENHLLTNGELRNLLAGIEVDQRPNRKGWLIRVDDIYRIELSTIEFCDVIDEISVFFLRKLGELLPDNRNVFRN